MSFKRITIEDLGLIKSYIDNQEYRSCDYTLGGVFMWVDYFNYQYDIIDGFLVIKGKYPENEEESYAFPLGKGDINKVLEELDKKATKPLAFASVPEEAIGILQDYFKERVEIIDTPQWADYLYNYADLATLNGKANSKHRNHVNKFMRTYPDYQFDWISEADLPEVNEFLKEYHKVGSESVISKYEILADINAINMFKTLNQKAACIRIGGKMVAITMGEVVGDTLYIHIEKAFREYEGSYATINKDFASHMMSPQIKYINREDDAGDEGLRIAKMNYHPVKLLKKYLAVIKNSI